jgi:hypothetical protein
LPIPLKIFSDDDREPERLWTGLPVTLPDATAETQPEEDEPEQPAKS